MARFRVAFIGIDHPHGAGWREVLPHLSAELELVALVPGFGGSVASLEERYSHLPRFSSVEELLQWNAFDGAIVCLPNAETPPVLTRLAPAGKHILTEKPGGVSATAFAPVVQAVQRAGVAFQAGYLWRYDPGANRLREMFRDGRFGRIISVEMSLVTSDVQRRGAGHYLFDPQQSGRGFFNWLGCHWLDLLPWITGEKVHAVTARTGNFGPVELPAEIEDGGTLVMGLSSGGLATFTGGYWLPRWVTEMHWVLRGTHRWLRWEPTAPGTGGIFRIHGPQPQFHAMEEVFTLPPDTTPGYGGARCIELIRDWVREASGEGRFCRADVTSTADMLQLLDGLYSVAAR
jgi:predicted dehydrogenase